MNKFHSTFYSVGNAQDFSPEAWESAFDPVNLEKWENDLGGSIQFFNGNGDQYSLIMNYWSGTGISFSYDRYNKNHIDRNFSMISRDNTKPLTKFECLKNGATVPIGSFLSLDRSRTVVKSFLVVPIEPPHTVDWVNANDLEWPDSD